MHCAGEWMKYSLSGMSIHNLTLHSRLYNTNVIDKLCVRIGLLEHQGTIK